PSRSRCGPGCTRRRKSSAAGSPRGAWPRSPPPCRVARPACARSPSPASRRSRATDRPCARTRASPGRCRAPPAGSTSSAPCRIRRATPGRETAGIGRRSRAQGLRTQANASRKVAPPEERPQLDASLLHRLVSALLAIDQRHHAEHEPAYQVVALRGQRSLLGIDVEVALLPGGEDDLPFLVGELGEQLEQAVPLAHLVPATRVEAPRARSSSHPTTSLNTRSRSGSWKSSCSSPSYCLYCLSLEVACSKNSRPPAGSATASAAPKSKRKGVMNSVARRRTVSCAAELS